MLTHDAVEVVPHFLLYFLQFLLKDLRLVHLIADSVLEVWFDSLLEDAADPSVLLFDLINDGIIFLSLKVCFQVLLLDLEAKRLCECQREILADSFSLPGDPLGKHLCLLLLPLNFELLPLDVSPHTR